MAKVPPVPRLPPLRDVDPAVAKFLEQSVTWMNAMRDRTGGDVDAVAAANTTAASAQATAEASAAAANTAQSTADTAGGGTAVSGSDTASLLDLAGTDWVEGPTVSLTGVVAGALTITGTTPQRSSLTALSGSVSMNCAYRIVEVIGAVDGDTVFEGTFSLVDTGSGEPGVPALVQLSHDSAAAIAAFSDTLATTGAIDYRMDLRRVSGATASGVGAYLFVRRA